MLGNLLRWWKVVSGPLWGDLIQTIGTVVIAPPEGDMAQYFASLEKMIQLDPKVIFPSHGMPLGGTNKLRETLNHRREREKQVTILLKKGLSPMEMVKKIYAHLPEELWPVAHATVQSHIKKIEESKF